MRSGIRLSTRFAASLATTCLFISQFVLWSPLCPLRPPARKLTTDCVLLLRRMARAGRGSEEVRWYGDIWSAGHTARARVIFAVETAEDAIVFEVALDPPGAQIRDVCDRASVIAVELAEGAPLPRLTWERHYAPTVGARSIPQWIRARCSG